METMQYFLNSSNGNKLSKKSSGGDVIDMETTVADGTFIRGAGNSEDPLTLSLPYKVSNIMLDRNNWVLESSGYYSLWITLWIT